MGLKRKKRDPITAKILRNADEIVAAKLDDEIYDELSRLGVIWSGILDLDSPILPADVAAMLSSHELLKATRLVDSEPHWTAAASFSAIGSFCEPTDHSIDPLIDDYEDDEVPGSGNKKTGTPIGFSPGHTVS